MNPPFSRLNIDADRLALAAVLLALLAHAPALPPLLWALPLAALASRRLAPGRRTAALRLIALTLATGAMALVAGPVDPATLRLTLLGALALKWAESRQPREYALVTGAAAVGTAIGLLGWGEASGVAFLLGSLVLLAATFLELDRTAPRTLTTSLRETTRRLGGALPLAALLFIFFPRIPGPLWDIGLTFGLPLAASLDKTPQGAARTMKPQPGQPQTGASDGEAVLVAEFDRWVPPTSQLYWRGPVYYDFDGSEWHLDPDLADGQGRRLMPRGWKRGRDFGQNFRSTANEVHYTARLSAHGALWLYGLDLPATLPAESFIGPDWQLLAHQPVRQETSYRTSAWLEWESAGTLAPALRERALALPGGDSPGNPRLRALGRQLAEAANHRIDDLLPAALAPLGRNGYAVRDRFDAPEGPDALDTFWFERKVGNSEYYAAAFVILMRAAGVPARLVTGYRGGKLMALTDYVVVKRNHAHAWAEIWDDTRGWRRIDPTDIVAPHSTTAPPPAPKVAATPAPRPQARPAGPGEPPDGAPSLAGRPASASAPIAPGSASPSLADWLGRWILHFNGDLQRQLLGDTGGLPPWAALLLGGTLTVATFFGTLGGLRRWHEQRRQPAAEKAWQRACRQLARQGITPQPGECPTRFIARAAAERPPLTAALTRLGNAYTSWRYAPPAPDAARQTERAARDLINRLLALPSRP